jgi:hypothetical protein
MQARFGLIAVLRKLRSMTTGLGLGMLKTERVIEIRRGLEATLAIYGLYARTFAWVKDMHEELESAHQVTFLEE